MLYQTWNLRFIPVFREEANIKNTADFSTFPSIHGFEDEKLYTITVRTQIINYLCSCESFLATTLFRTNHYTQKLAAGISYHTDGEVIFNNMLLEYIQQPCFVLPQKWFELIHRNDFKLRKFSIDSDLIFDSLDVFKTMDETFKEESTITQVIRYLKK